MDLLGLVILIAISVISSVKKSNDAKQQRAKRQQSSQQSVYRSQGSSVASAEKKAAVKKPAAAKKNGSQDAIPEPLEAALDGMSGLFGGLYNMLGMEQPEAEQKSAPSKPKTAAGGKKKGRAKAVTQAGKKSPAELPKQTLMEQRPDREQREAHTKVSASVKPLKNAFENDELCEHRIELNPNIQYSKQKQAAATQRVAVVKTDGDSIIQGMIWAEVLGKPKAYQRPGNGLRR